MYINVKLFTTLVKYVLGTEAGVPFGIELPEGASISDLIEILKLPKADVKIIFVNGRNQSLNYKLNPGDEVGIFPAIGGG